MAETVNRPAGEHVSGESPLQRVQHAFGGDYIIEREIGAGGMATVFAARDVRHERRVAIKVMRSDFAHGVASDRFLREISIAAKLQHPHILGLLDSGSADGLLYYVMPYVEGAALRLRLSREGELPLDDAIRLLQQVLDALSHAHAQGIVHRDIKPENVLLSGWTSRTGAGGRWHSLVADFGVAKAFSDASESVSITGSGMAMGTPMYMSPEQAAADPHVDHRADLYAVGALAYEMLAGVPPFMGSNPQAVIAAHMTRRPDPISRHRDNVPAELQQLVMRALEKRPADRWQSADEMLKRLEALLTPSHGTPAAIPKVRHVAERTFKLSDKVCRTLDRKTLDPRVIGSVMSYFDNGASSDVLVFLLPRLTEEVEEFREMTSALEWRTIAPTLLGFEPSARRRIPVAFRNHLGMLRELLRETIAEVQPRVTIVAGMSAGADLSLRLYSEMGDDVPRINGLLALGPNLSLETCFVTKVMSRMRPENEVELLAELGRMSASLTSLEEWLDVHEYFVNYLRKFGRDVEAIRQFSADIIAPFEAQDEMTFAQWIRAASGRVPVVRCVVEDTPTSIRVVQALRMRNLDEPVFGERYTEDTIVVEPGTTHMGLMKTDVVRSHLDALLAAIQ